MNPGGFILPLVLALPLVGAIFVMCTPKTESSLHRGLGIAMSTVTFLVSLVGLKFFNAKSDAFQLVFDAEWIPGLGAHFKTGVDGISIFLVILTTFLMPLTLIGTRKAVEKHSREFIACMLVLEAGMLGAFVGLDLFLFYVSWEVMLIPMYLLIGIWGGQRRLYASIKFVIYTMVGSLLMLVAIFYVYVQGAAVLGGYTTDLEKLLTVAYPYKAQFWCFGAFALAFAIKVPLFPLHTWLPDAHVEAPTAGSVILAGVLLKFGIYGFLRFAMPLFPHGAAEWAPALAILSVIGIIYGALVAFAQDDVKKLVAYSSVSHLGFCMIGVLSLTVYGTSGSIYAMLSHGLTTGGRAACVGAGSYFAGTCSGVFIFPTNGGPALRLCVTNGLPSDDVSAVAFLDGKLYVGTGDLMRAGYLAAYDPATRQVSVLASSRRSEVLSPLDDKPPFYIPCLVSDPPRHRLLITVCSLPTGPSKTVDSSMGIWTYSPLTGEFSRVAPLYLRARQIAFKHDAWAGLADSHTLIVRGPNVFFDLRNDTLRAVYGSSARQVGESREHWESPIPGSLNHTFVLGPFLIDDGWLYSTHPFERRALADAHREQFVPLRTDYKFEPGECLQLLDNGKHVLAADPFSIWLLEVGSKQTQASAGKAAGANSHQP